MFCGFFLGLGVLAPGISGSVMAIIMGIYDRLLEIIANPFKNFKKNFFYLLPMVIGGFASLVLFALLFYYLFTAHERETYLLIIGLIVGNLPVVFKKALHDGFKKRYMIGALVACGLAVAIGLLRHALPVDQGAVFLLPDFSYLALCGLAAGAASMIPGLSCTLVLVIMGVFEYLMRTAYEIISDFSRRGLGVAGIVGGCFIIAMVLTSKVARRVFARYPGAAYFAVFGFMCGSLADIGMGLPRSEGSWLVGGGMLAVGLVVSVLFALLGRRFNAAPEAHLLPADSEKE